MATTDDARLDGNAVAGALGELLGIDTTMASTRCATCGRRSLLAEHHAYLDAPAPVLRCPHCEQVTLRVVRTPHGVHVDVAGLHTVVLPAAGARDAEPR